MKTQVVALFAFVVLGGLFGSGSASAVTLNVATGPDEKTTNSSCSLSEALENINDQLATNTDCAAGDGISDTIIIPAGTVTLFQDLENITEPVTIRGANMNETIIDGGGVRKSFNVPIGVTGTVEITDMKIQGFREYAIGNEGANMRVERVEIDGTDATYNNGTLLGITFIVQDQTLNVEDVYIHDISTESDAFLTGGILIGTSGTEMATVNISRVTIENINSASSTALGIGHVMGYMSNGAESNITTVIENTTVSNVHASGTDPNSSSGVGIGFNGMVDGGSSQLDITLINNTITNITQGLDRGAALGLNLAAIADGDTFDLNADISNQLFTTGSDLSNCYIRDFTGDLEGLGAVTFNVASSGGNLSDDDSCTSDFDHISDRNNLSALANGLGSLADNGGFVPTISLNPDSVAVDAGVAVGALDDDARGTFRPQFAAYDSGAFELTQSDIDAYNLANEEEAGTSEELAETGANIYLVALLGLATLCGGSILVFRTSRR